MEKSSSCDLRFSELKTAVSSRQIKYVIHFQNWTNAGHDLITRSSGEKRSAISNTELIEQKYKLLSLLRPDQKLILIGVPEVPRFEIFDCLSANQSMFDFVKQKCPATKQRTISHINRKLKQLAKEQDSVVFLNPKDILCSDETCQL